ncbi:MAG: hypothetical protein AAF961_17060 [Planctomycetota bacterium]
MFERPFWTAVVGLFAAAVLGFFWRRWRAAQLDAKQRLAMIDFVERSDELGASFLAAAGRLGKPRGLRWKSCTLRDDRRFAKDRSTGELVGLASVEIGFEAIEGGGMEDVEAVGNIRLATSVFTWRDGEWTTDGRAVFNLDPGQTLERYADSLASTEPLRA